MYHTYYHQRAYGVQNAHELYGPIVRISPNEISFSDPKVLPRLYSHNAGFAKSDFYVSNYYSIYDNTTFEQRLGVP